MTHHRNLKFCDEGGKKARETKHNPEKINSKVEDILDRSQYITQCNNITSVNPLKLLGYTFMYNYDGAQIYSDIKEFLEKE